MKVEHADGSRPIKMWAEDIEPQAMEQLRNIAKLPFIDQHGIAVMPDVHFGIGATVGSVIATSKVIIPAAVGVDIGCGMVAVRTSLVASDLPDNLAEIRHAIERGVPVGFSQHQKASDESLRFMVTHISPQGVNHTKASNQLGTLGGGNHFIEICLDTEQRVWVMLHSGSRGTGNQIGRKYIDKAKELCARWHIDLPHGDLAYLPEGDSVFDEYVEAVQWAQDYAAENRRLMLAEVLRNLVHHIPKPFTLTEEAINCHHNYISRESHHGRNLWVTRKGAIRARKDDLGIIPGSMGQRSFIVRGLGNDDSYHSCSHGAGRAMSRTAARKMFTVADLVVQTEGVECRKDEGVLDELPSGYKDIDAVMAAQTDLVEVMHTLKQVLCVKG